MNCKQANEQISIKEVLQSFSIYPSKENSKSAFYYAIDREEKTPSLSVSYQKNVAFDFGTGKAYNNVSIVQCLKKCSVAEALEYLSIFDSNFIKPPEIKGDGYTIIEIIPVKHPALLEYLKERKLLNQRNQIREIHYEIKDKRYFAIGFKNESGGYEIRNKYAKICLGKKDITHKQNGYSNLKVFEGFSDYLSYKEFGKTKADYLILNSITMIGRAKNILKMYNGVDLYLDNDVAGDTAVRKIKSIQPSAVDCRYHYKEFKDLNEFAIETIL